MHLAALVGHGLAAMVLFFGRRCKISRLAMVMIACGIHDHLVMGGGLCVHLAERAC